MRCACSSASVLLRDQPVVVHLVGADLARRARLLARRIARMHRQLLAQVPRRGADAEGLGAGRDRQRL
jgi:hypothetical protein